MPTDQLASPASVPTLVTELVERFARDPDHYASSNYNEAQLRREFIDPLFEALGWDIANRAGYSDAYKDVIHEDSIKIGSATKAPDYCFRIGGSRKFFVEAKRPSVDILNNISAAYQLRRYAWSAKLPISILTNFSALAIYDCRSRPYANAKASACRVFLCDYTSLPARWPELVQIISKDAVLKGNFDRFAGGTRAKRGTAGVDDSFLAEIERWRLKLAENIAARNHELDQVQLNLMVTKTIDRIIFLRICEDRGIEPYGQLMALANGEKTYARLYELFERADEKYNSGLFYFTAEKGRSEDPDRLSRDLTVADEPIQNIVQSLYYPESPYEFSVLPADILGHIYERFLGKVARLTPARRVKIEEKPDVRKAGGIYYTPAYIVNFIVADTIAPLVSGKSAEQIAKIRILDPACGSGSFLLGAYDYLLASYLHFYTSQDVGAFLKRKNPPIRQISTTASANTDLRGVANQSVYKLTLRERKRILLRHIFGVDIDPSAVETSKLSLLLKVLEGESEETVANQFKLFRERALPDLAGNIKCGNSLIGPDFYDRAEASLIDSDAAKVNIFDWATEFGEVMKDGGFNAVIGNPPYGATLTESEERYLRSVYRSSGRDTYGMFMELSSRLLRVGGTVSMIVPTGWYSGSKSAPLRRFMATAFDPRLFVNLPYDVFSDAWVDTTIFCMTKRAAVAVWPRRDRCDVVLKTFPKRHVIRAIEEFGSKISTVVFSDWFAGDQDSFLTYADAPRTAIINKIRSTGVALGDIADVQRGVTPFKLAATAEYPSSRSAFTGAVFRYTLRAGPAAFVRFDATLAEPKPARYFTGKRILLRELISRRFRLQAAMATEDFITNKSMQTILATGRHAPEYILAIINSRLLSWYFLRVSNIGQRDDFPKIVLRETRALPIRQIDLSQSTDAALHGEIIQAVANLTETLANVSADKAGAEAANRRFQAIDARIDKLIYDLYGLTDDQIAAVEDDMRGTPAASGE